MIIVLKQNTKPEQLENLEAWIHSMGIETHVSIGKTHTIIGLVGDTSQVDMRTMTSSLWWIFTNMRWWAWCWNGSAGI